MKSSNRDLALVAAACLAATAMLAGCGGGGSGGGGGFPFVTLPPAAPPPASPPPASSPPPSQPVALTCDQLQGMTVPASAIGLPTSGATVTSVKTVAASGSGAAAVPEYCEVAGKIAPVDAAAPNILFQLALPTRWNQKVVMFGGGGFNGTIPNVKGNVPNGPVDQPTPLGRGYATFASDSGHQANALGSQDGSFGLNDEAVRNFGGDVLKKVHDVALSLVKARYAASPLKAYFAGGSTGGREALTAIQRWPADWDGAIAWYPAWNDASALLAGHRMSRALAQPGAYPNVPKREVLYKAAMEACDALDGATDGLISNQNLCNARFDPSTATLPGRWRHRQHLPVGCADRGTEDHRHADQLQLPARERGDAVPGLQRVGRRPGHHHLALTAGAGGDLPRVRHLAAGAADAGERALHQRAHRSVDQVFGDARSAL